jgi:hypothetical protein
MPALHLVLPLGSGQHPASQKGQRQSDESVREVTQEGFDKFPDDHDLSTP